MPFIEQVTKCVHSIKEDGVDKEWQNYSSGFQVISQHKNAFYLLQKP
jgi:hypothetical protein